LQNITNYTIALLCSSVPVPYLHEHSFLATTKECQAKSGSLLTIMWV